MRMARTRTAAGWKHGLGRSLARQKIMKKHSLATTISILLALLAMPVVHAAERGDAVSEGGFYGGVSLRASGTEGAGLVYGPAASPWSRFAPPTREDAGARALVFGGYRWSSDVALEASFTSSEKYALRPADPGTGRQGVGLSLAGAAAGLADLQSRSWNVDVYTSWTFLRSFALYGRLGYAQAETAPLFAPSVGAAPDARRVRDGVNYGVGFRYDMNPALGLRLEYGRFGRFAGEIPSGTPETDQVSVGVQLRF
jgi:hypothetical protein